MARVKTRIGDVFSVKIDEQNKKYFQYITNDLLQLNSDVIRAFTKIYPMNSTPDLSEVVKDKVAFFAHCITPLGVKMNLWTIEGNIDYKDETSVLFRDTNDYGSKPGEQIKVSHNWYVWKIGDEDFTRVGKLEGENQKAEIGIVINPLGIIELLKGNKYPVFYPDYQ